MLWEEVIPQLKELEFTREGGRERSVFQGKTPSVQTEEAREKFK